MKYKLTYRRLLSFISSISLILSLTILPADAISGTIYETESNNTYSTADTTYDDYSNYGVISSSSDVDWWKITFSQSGMANFYLGDIPNGNDYDLKVFKTNMSTPIAESLKASNNSELIKIHVYAGETYYVRVFSNSGYSTSLYYQLRIKRYELRPAKVFTANGILPASFNSRGVATQILPTIWNMGFGAQEYLNNTAASYISALPTSDIFVSALFGRHNDLFLNESYVLSYHPEASHPNYSISNYSSGALNDVKLVVFASGYSGSAEIDAVSFVDETLQKGAFCCIGWTENIDTDSITIWCDYFFENLDNGQNIGNSIKLATESALVDGADDSIASVYYGSS